MSPARRAEERVVRAAAALGVGVCAAMLAYAAQRGWQVLAGGEENPATVFARLHMAFFWRAWTSVFAGGMAALIALLAARDVARLVRALPGALVACAALLVAQAVFFP